MNPNRQTWNASHQKLHRALSTADHAAATELFLSLHAMVHTANMSKSGLWSFEDEVLCDLSDDQLRQIPRGGEHSIAWIMFHLTRCEDITMNMLVAGAEQLFTQNDWAKKMNVEIIHSANSMDDESMANFSAKVDIKALKAYRILVGHRTRQIVKKLKADDYQNPVDPLRSQRLLQAGAVSPDAMEIFHYWATRTIAGLLLMPPTRHCFLHWNEGLKIKKKLLK